MMAEAAAFNAARGAKIIDINMGCPVKKVRNVASGSALLRHEDLIVRILDAVVAACAPLGVPVTLKTRTGWDRESRNAARGPAGRERRHRRPDPARPHPR